MSTRSERDKQKAINDKHIAILGALLKEEDNKYCVDCDAKGPRWASWNLGIFLCIRCAGIHRNLGVHISKVKSVNLDSWTPEQIAMVQEMGNSRARAVYEANLPDHYRRPQSDSSLEAFIRAKYETKKYIAKEWVPPKPKAPPAVVEEKKEKKRSRPKSSANIQLNNATKSISSPTHVHKEEKEKVPPKKKESAPIDLLGLDSQPAAAPVAKTNGATNDDLFTDFMSANTMPAQASMPPPLMGGGEQLPVQDGSKEKEDETNLFGESPASMEEKKSTKESILALYGSGSNQQSQMFAGNQPSDPTDFGFMAAPSNQTTPQYSQSQMMSAMGVGPQQYSAASYQAYSGTFNSSTSQSLPTQAAEQSTLLAQAMQYQDSQASSSGQYHSWMLGTSPDRRDVQSPSLFAPQWVQSSASSNAIPQQAEQHFQSSASMMGRSSSNTQTTSVSSGANSQRSTTSNSILLGEASSGMFVTPSPSQQQAANMGQLFGSQSYMPGLVSPYAECGMYMTPQQQQMYMGQQMGHQPGMQMIPGMGQPQGMAVSGMQMQGQGFPQQQGNMMMQRNNMTACQMGNAYNMQQQQQMAAQVQNQLANMHISGQATSHMMNYPQQNAVPVGNSGGWGQQQTGQTLSTNLWQ